MARLVTAPGPLTWEHQHNDAADSRLPPCTYTAIFICTKMRPGEQGLHRNIYNLEQRTRSDGGI